jgi:hexokinase
MRPIVTHLIAAVLGAAISWGKIQTTVTKTNEHTQDNSTIVKVKKVGVDGSVVERTRIFKDVSKNAITDTKTDTKQGSALSSDKVRISALISASVLSSGGLSYGASVQKRILGPVNFGLFGLTNGTMGAMIGVDL